MADPTLNNVLVGVVSVDLAPLFRAVVATEATSTDQQVQTLTAELNSLKVLRKFLLPSSKSKTALPSSDTQSLLIQQISTRQQGLTDAKTLQARQAVWLPQIK